MFDVASAARLADRLELARETCIQSQMAVDAVVDAVATIYRDCHNPKAS